jgi:hypothetical protein
MSSGVVSCLWQQALESSETKPFQGFNTIMCYKDMENKVLGEILLSIAFQIIL